MTYARKSLVSLNDTPGSTFTVRPGVSQGWPYIECTMLGA
jgi:hypothetical protein